MISRSTAIVLLVASLAAVAASQLLIKARFGAEGLGGDAGPLWSGILVRLLTDPAVWLCGLLLVLGALAWYLALTRLALSFMLPVACSVSPILAIAAGYWLGEPLPPQKLAAICLIAIGVAWLGFQGE